MSPEFQRFDETVNRLEANLRSHRVELEQVERDLTANANVTVANTTEIADARKVGKRGVVVGILGVVVGLVGIAVGADGRQTAKDNKDIIATQTKDRQEARLGSCIQSNVAVKKTREALVAGLGVFIVPIPGREEAELQRLEQLLADFELAVNKALPYRDCSDKGIDKFFEDPPRDPALAQ